MISPRKPGLGAVFGGLAAVLVLMTAACDQSARPGAAEAGAITFAILSAEDRASAEPLWQPLLDDMAEAIGVPVEARFGQSYDELVEAMADGQVQAGWFSARVAIDAIDRAGAEVLARTVNAEGEDSYRAVLIARAGGGVTLDRVMACDRTLRIGLGDAGSTSATLAPTTFLFAPKGQDPQRCFREVRIGNHQENANAVAAGTLDVAASNTVTLTAMMQRNPQLAGQLTEVWRSRPLPEGAILMRSDLDPTVREKARSFLLTYGQGDTAEAGRQRKVLAALNYSQFRAADENYLDPVREMVLSQRLSEALAAGDRAGAETARRDLQSLQARREVLP